MSSRASQNCPRILFLTDVWYMIILQYATINRWLSWGFVVKKKNWQDYHRRTPQSEETSLLISCLTDSQPDQDLNLHRGAPESWRGGKGTAGGVRQTRHRCFHFSLWPLLHAQPSGTKLPSDTKELILYMIEVQKAQVLHPSGVINEREHDSSSAEPRLAC